MAHESLPGMRRLTVLERVWWFPLLWRQRSYINLGDRALEVGVVYVWRSEETGHACSNYRSEQLGALWFIAEANARQTERLLSEGI